MKNYSTITYSDGSDELVDVDTTAAVGVELGEHLGHLVVRQLEAALLQPLRQLLEAQLLVSVVIHTTEYSART